jgi:hypothetical protein
MGAVRKRHLTFVATAVAGVLVIGGAAYACTVFAGNMSITDNANGANTSKGIGNGSAMAFCQSGGNWTPSRVSVSQSSGFTVSVSPDAAHCSSGLFNGTAYVLYNQTSNTDPADAGTDCHSSAHGTTLTSFTITGQAGQKSVTASSLTAANDYKICVNDSGGRIMMGFIKVY